MRFCEYCGNEILSETAICLNCGCEIKGKKSFIINQTVNSKTESKLATWAKILGIVSLFIGWFALGITAIVLACMSKSETNGIMCSSAKVGYVCGMISTILTFILFVILVSVITYLSMY